MSITPYLDDFDVDPETKRVLDVALEMTRVSLGLADDFANRILAKRIIELAEVGERNPSLLCEGALKKLRGLCTATNTGDHPTRPGPAGFPNGGGARPAGRGSAAGRNLPQRTRLAERHGRLTNAWLDA
jgi:hypothetical protein